MSELDEKIFHWLNPDGCWHDPKPDGVILERSRRIGKGPTRLVRCRLCKAEGFKGSLKNPAYSTDPVASYALIEAVNGKGYFVEMTSSSIGASCDVLRWVDGQRNGQVTANADKLPMALSLAVSALIDAAPVTEETL